MNTQEKCEAIIRAIGRSCSNQDDDGEIVVAFSSDWGPHTLTVHLRKHHTHVGFPDCTFEQMVDGLYALLCIGSGLSLV